MIPRQVSSTSKDTLRPRFANGSQRVLLWRLFQLLRSHRGNMDFVRWIGKFTVTRKRGADAWMDLLPDAALTDPMYIQCFQFVNQQRAQQDLEPFEPNAEAPFNEWRDTRRRTHEGQFPLGDNLFTLIFIVLSDLTETQRERLQSTMSSEGITCKLTRSMPFVQHPWSFLRAQVIP